jgi:CRISPR-associated endonuclease Cas2
MRITCRAESVCMSDERLYIVTYDITNQRRWRRVFKAMHGYGEWLQLSVFQCRLARRRRAEMETRLRELVKNGGRPRSFDRRRTRRQNSLGRREHRQGFFEDRASGDCDIVVLHLVAVAIDDVRNGSVCARS